jgi:hypothetical protein
LDLGTEQTAEYRRRYPVESRSSQGYNKVPPRRCLFAVIPARGPPNLGEDAKCHDTIEGLLQARCGGVWSRFLGCLAVIGGRFTGLSAAEWSTHTGRGDRVPPPRSAT